MYQNCSFFIWIMYIIQSIRCFDISLFTHIVYERPHGSLLCLPMHDNHCFCIEETNITQQSGIGFQIFIHETLFFTFRFKRDLQTGFNNKPFAWIISSYFMGSFTTQTKYFMRTWFNFVVSAVMVLMLLFLLCLLSILRLQRSLWLQVSLLYTVRLAGNAVFTCS